MAARARYASACCGCRGKVTAMRFKRIPQVVSKEDAEGSIRACRINFYVAATCCPGHMRNCVQHTSKPMPLRSMQYLFDGVIVYYNLCKCAHVCKHVIMKAFQHKTHSHTLTQANTHTHTHAHSNTHTYTYFHTNTPSTTHSHARARSHTNTNTHTYTHIHTHMHVSIGYWLVCLVCIRTCIYTTTYIYR